MCDKSAEMWFWWESGVLSGPRRWVDAAVGMGTIKRESAIDNAMEMLRDERHINETKETNLSSSVEWFDHRLVIISARELNHPILPSVPGCFKGYAFPVRISALDNLLQWKNILEEYLQIIIFWLYYCNWPNFKTPLFASSFRYLPFPSLPSALSSCWLCTAGWMVNLWWWLIVKWIVEVRERQREKIDADHCSLL